MGEESYVSNIWKIAALAVSSGYMLIKAQQMTRVIIITLVLLCLFTVQFFLSGKIKELINHHKSKAKLLMKVDTVITVIAGTIIFACSLDELTPVMFVLAISIIRQIQDDMMFYGISAITIFLYINIEPLHDVVLILSLVIVFGYLLNLYYAKKTEVFKKKMIKQSQQMTQLEEKMKDNEHLMKTIRYATALEERNRMAARLHDKIGHNISGTILMLEASLLQMEKNPDKALDEINRAVEHLRDGVDDLRHALREERPVISDVNSSDIQLLLDQTGIAHGIHTVFKTEGNLNEVSLELWQCVKDNATELITNVLKHSKATVFSLAITVMPSMIRVIYSDNGPCLSTFEKGLGLEAVEERTVRCNGRCFFEASELGFKVTNIFMKSNH